MSDGAAKTEQAGIQVIARAAAILRALKTKRGGMSLGEIAAAVGLPRSTVQRITRALAEERLVVADARRGGVRLGPELGALAEAARETVAQRCKALLRQIADATGETTDLAALRGASMLFIDQVPGRHRLRTVSAIGEVFPLASTANGRACLALLPEESAERMIVDEWARLGIDDDLPAFMRMLARIRDDGLAYDINEHTDGISAIGVAFYTPGGEPHAISVPAPSSRFTQSRPKIEAALRNARLWIDQNFP